MIKTAGLEDIIAFKELGTAAIFLLVFYIFAESYRKDFFKQLDQTNKRAEENQKSFMDFINGAYKDTAIQNAKLVVEVEKVITAVNNVVKEVENLSELQEKFKEQQKYGIEKVINGVDKVGEIIEKKIS